MGQYAHPPRLEYELPDRNRSGGSERLRLILLFGLRIMRRLFPVTSLSFVFEIKYFGPPT